MKLSFKIMSIVFLGIFVLLVIDGYLAVQREIELFTQDVQHDALLLGQAAKPLVSEAWEHGGQSHALELIESINQDESLLQIRWVWLDAAPDDPFAPRVALTALDSVSGDQEAFIKKTSKNSFGSLYVYIPMEIQGQRPAAL